MTTRSAVSHGWGLYQVRPHLREPSTKLWKIIVVGAFFGVCVLPTSWAAHAEPMPGKWEKSIASFVFDDKTKTYLPLFESSDTECLPEAYFQEKIFHEPHFFAQQSARQGRQCIISNEGLLTSATTWQQVCTDPNGSKEVERWSISMSGNEVTLEHRALTTRRYADPESDAESKEVTKFKRIGECDKTVSGHLDANDLSQTRSQQSEQVSSDLRYELRDGGIVKDTKTGLEWTQSDNGSDINWSDAARYCAAKGNEWRLASADELEGLYDTAQSTSCGKHMCRVSSKFRLTESWFWSSEFKRPSIAWTVYLHVGRRYAHHVEPQYYSRALCVKRS